MTEPFGPAQFDVVQAEAASATRRRRACVSVEVRIRNGHEDRLASALGWPSWRSRHVIGFPYPKSTQMTMGR
jgi:hypothetical protein